MICIVKFLEVIFIYLSGLAKLHVELSTRTLMLPEACSEFLPELLVRLLKLLPLDKLALLWATGIKRLQKLMDVYLG